MNKRERLILDLDFENNNASPSIFGWEFQLLSAIPFVLSDIKEISHFVIEGQYQDVEVFYNNHTQAFIQAKAIHMSESEEESIKNSKFKQAIVSLYKCPFLSGDKIVYSSNFKSPILNDPSLFENRFIRYNECPPSIQKHIDSLIDDAAKSVENELNNKKASLEKEGKQVDPKYVRRMNSLSKRLKETTIRDDLYFLSIYPFFGEGNMLKRTDCIDNSILKFLSSEDLDYDSKSAIVLSTKLLNYWTNYLLNDAATNTKDIHKTITKQDFLWPIVVYDSSFNYEIIKETMADRITISDINDAGRYLNDAVFIQLQRFEFLHKLYKDFNDFRRITTSSNFEIDFINEKWDLYKKEFDCLTSNEILIEYITKNYIYRLLGDFNNVMRLNRGANLWK